MYSNLFDDFDYDSGMLDGGDTQGPGNTSGYDDWDDDWDYIPDWKEESGWNDAYGSDVEVSDIIEFGD